MFFFFFVSSDLTGTRLRLLFGCTNRFEDAQGSKKSSNDELPADVRGGAQASGLRSKEREKEKEKENKHIAAYLSLCEKQWSEMTKQAFNNTEMLNVSSKLCFQTLFFFCFVLVWENVFEAEETSDVFIF